MLIEYHFKIKYTKGTKKPLGALLKLDKDGLIRYNYPKIAVI